MPKIHTFAFSYQRKSYVPAFFTAVNPFRGGFWHLDHACHDGVRKDGYQAWRHDRQPAKHHFNIVAFYRHHTNPGICC